MPRAKTSDKALKEINARLLLENTRSSLEAAETIINDKDNHQRVGMVQSILRSGITPTKSMYPLIKLSIKPELAPLDKVSKLIELSMAGKLSADHCSLFTTAILAAESLRHDLKFQERLNEYREFIGLDKAILIEEIADLRRELRGSKHH